MGNKMENKERFFEMINELRIDNAVKQKKGLHFILTSVIIWTMITLVQASTLPIMTKNMLTFFCSVPLMPLAFLVSKWIKVDFQNKSNPLTSLGIIFSVNQMLYILIAMWVCSSVPDKMLMVYAMIFGAHLMPYGWLYQSRTYFVLSVIIPIGALMLGLYSQPVVLAAAMVCVEIIFCVCLFWENRGLKSANA